MTTDRELVELAAKAAGIEIYESTDGTIQNRPVWVFSAGGGMGTMPYEEQWNPLIDDAQALRLAVKLCLSADFFDDEICVGYTPNCNACDQLKEPVNNDPYAATRRAIVRAAAEIGKGMG